MICNSVADTKLQPRVWWAEQRTFVLDHKSAEKLFPVVNLTSEVKNKFNYAYLYYVEQLMDAEDDLGIERDDWIYADYRFYFTDVETAVLFKLLIDPE